MDNKCQTCPIKNTCEANMTGEECSYQPMPESKPYKLTIYCPYKDGSPCPHEYNCEICKNKEAKPDKLLGETRLTKIKKDFVPWYLNNKDVKAELDKQDTFTRHEIAEKLKATSSRLFDKQENIYRMVITCEDFDKIIADLEGT
jgi:hypothetical protein